MGSVKGTKQDAIISLLATAVLALGVLSYTLRTSEEGSWRSFAARDRQVAVLCADPCRLPAAARLACGGRIAVNRDPPRDLALLPGIGEVLAGRIAASRDADGPFASAADLDRVAGIGPKTVARVEPWISFERACPPRD